MFNQQPSVDPLPEKKMIVPFPPGSRCIRYDIIIHSFALADGANQELVTAQYIVKDQKCRYCEQDHHCMVVRLPMSQDNNAKWRDAHPCTWVPPVPEKHSLLARIEADLVQLVGPCQRHTHSSTCYNTTILFAKRILGSKKAAVFTFRECWSWKRYSRMKANLCCDGEATL
jgi:hypothetical protein